MKVIKLNNLKFNVRRCVADDYWFCYFLSKKNMLSYVVKYWGRWNPRAYRKDFDKRNVKIIRYKGKRVGFYNLVIKRDCAYLYNIQVSGPMRGRGLGTKLLELIEQEVKLKRMTRVNLQVFKDNPSKNLYGRVGYKVVKDRGSSLIMEKRL